MQIQATQLSKSFHDKGRKTTAYKELTFKVGPGEFFCILGPSGCGELKIDSHSSRSADIAMVFQEQDLFPWMSLKDNIRFILENNSQMAGRNIDDICNDFLCRVGLEKFAHYFPHQASGGMRQRVSIARAFANEPDLLLMDEPFVFVDYQTRLALQQLLLTIWHEAQKTVVFVTHDIEEAVLLADRIMVMTSHPGKIKTLIDIDLPRPRNILYLQKQPEYHQYVNNILDLLQEETTSLDAQYEEKSQT